MRNTTWDGPRKGSSTSMRPGGIFSISSKKKIERAHSVKLPCTQRFKSSFQKNKGNFNPGSHTKAEVRSTIMQSTNLPCTLLPGQVKGNATWEQTDGHMGCSLLSRIDDFPAWSWPSSFLSQKGREKTKPGDGLGFYSEGTLPPPLKQYPGPDVVHKGFCRGPTPDLVRKYK